MNDVTVTAEIKTSVPRIIYKKVKTAGTNETMPIPQPIMNHRVKVPPLILRFFKRYRSMSITVAENAMPIIEYLSTGMVSSHCFY